MPEGNFKSLREELLRAGIAPKHVRRLMTELESHYELLLEEERARGQALELARTLARKRLGANENIVKKALEQPALKSWGARWPLGICGLAPAAGLFASAVAVLLALVSVFAVGEHLHPTFANKGDPWAFWVQQGTELLRWLVLYGLPVLWTWALARYAVTRRMGTLWPITGFVLTAALGAATNVSVVWPQPGVHGQLSAGVGVITNGDELMDFGLRWAATLLLALTVYFLMRQWFRATDSQRA
jgi:hypothetical protein